MTLTSVESESQFGKLLPELVQAYSFTSDEGEHNKLAQQLIDVAPVHCTLSERLKDEIRISKFEQAKSHDELVQSVHDCTTILVQRQKDVRDFAELVCFHAVQIKVNGQTNPQLRVAALESARKPLLKAISAVEKPVPLVLTADLMVQPLSIVQTQTSEWAVDACRSIISQLLMSLHVLVEKDVIGLIEWPGETVCKLQFFQHVVTQDQIRSKTTERTHTKTNADSTRLRTVEKWEQTKGHNVFSIERHEHHVMNAEERTPEDAKHEIPKEHQNFLERIPQWIRKYITVLEGDLFREEIVTKNVRKTTFQSKPVRRSISEETLPAIRPAFEIDPAILLGHFVLTGWTQKEIDKEKHRRATTAAEPVSQHPRIEHIRKDAGSAYGSLMPAAIICAIGSALMMSFSRLQPGMMNTVSMFLAAVSLVLCWNCFRQYSRWCRGHVDVMFVIAGTVAVGFGLIFVLSTLHGILYGKFGVAMGGLVAVIFAKTVWRIARERMPG